MYVHREYKQVMPGSSFSPLCVANPNTCCFCNASQFMTDIPVTQLHQNWNDSGLHLFGMKKQCELSLSRF